MKSVAMAFYNGAKYIDEQIRSILDNMEETDELIISVDDASDGSEAILRNWVENDQRIRMIKGPGKGVVKNFENAFKHCRGEIIFLSDQDDVWKPDKIYLTLQKMEALEAKGRGGSFSYLKLGWILHYVEDYFTYPHNTIFEGTIPEHYAYEKKMTRWMREGALEQMSLPMCKRLDSAAEVEERLQELHDRYLSQKMCYENDMAYMRQMVSEILNCYAEIFVRKSEFARFMEWVRKKVGIMTGFVS